MSRHRGRRCEWTRSYFGDQAAGVAAKFGYAVGHPAAIGMLAILLALAAAAGYGGSDFAAGLASPKASVLLVTFVATLCALVPTLVVLPWAGTQTLSAAALGWG